MCYPNCPMGTFPYRIRPGDTLYSIAMRYNTTVGAIMRVNPGLDPYNLRIGQLICIPYSYCPVGTIPYIVQPGDTFYSIARRYNVTVRELMAANPGVDPNNLMVGQRICIPQQPPTSCPPGTFVYVIRPGDTYYSLAMRYNTTVAAIARANPGVDPNNLQIGQKICIPLENPSTCPPGTFVYTVKAGDTYYNLAIRYNTTVAAITRANPGVDPNNLQIGQKICIPRSVTNGCPVGTFPYTIKSGDTFYKLAQQYNTTVAAIQAANPGVDPNNLQIGQVICIPSTSSGKCPVGTFAYTVKSGDTFYKLAQQYNTTVAAIQAANPGVDPNNLQIGQVICIPN